MSKVKHGHSPSNGTSKTYNSWVGMVSRCKYKKHASYKNYGARGIKVCTEWQNSFSNFLRDMGERPLNTSLDRIDNNKDYCKENCRWASRDEQFLNMRSNRFITYKGKTQTITQWSKELNINKATLTNRLNRGGRTIEECFLDRIGSHPKNKKRF